MRQFFKGFENQQQEPPDEEQFHPRNRYEDPRLEKPLSKAPREICRLSPEECQAQRDGLDAASRRAVQLHKDMAAGLFQFTESTMLLYEEQERCKDDPSHLYNRPDCGDLLFSTILSAMSALLVCRTLASPAAFLICL